MKSPYFTPNLGGGFIICWIKMGVLKKIVFYPQTPQGGLSKSLDFNKSPLGDLGV